MWINLSFEEGKKVREVKVKTIRKKNGKIYILTRNPTAYLKKEQIFFPEIINSLEGTRTFTLKELHYCPPSISKSAYIKKVN